MIRFIIAIVGFGIAGGVFVLYTKPAYDRIQGLQTEIAQYDQALERANELQRLKQELLTKFNAFNPADIERLQKLLPDHVDNVRLILDFDNLASRHSLAIQNVVIGRATDPDAPQGKNAPEVIGGNDRPYDSLTLRFSTQGTYPGFVTFMEDLQASLRIVDLVSLSLARASQEEEAGEPYYRFDVAIRTYWLKK
jgi:Tfp pilus assembly protein PilO